MSGEAGQGRSGIGAHSQSLPSQQLAAEGESLSFGAGALGFQPQFEVPIKQLACGIDAREAAKEVSAGGSQILSLSSQVQQDGHNDTRLF